MLVGNRGTMCNTTSQGESPTTGDTDRFALVTRGGCKFATKAENAVREGFSGVVILDNQNTTNVNKISGSRSALTDGIPVIFLLQTEANLLIKLMEEEDRRNISIAGGKTFIYLTVLVIGLGNDEIFMIIISDSSTLFEISSTTTTTTTSTTTARSSGVEVAEKIMRYISMKHQREEELRRDFRSKYGSDIFTQRKHPFNEGIFIRTKAQTRPSPSPSPSSSPPPPLPPPSSRPAHVVTVTDEPHSRNRESINSNNSRSRKIVMEMTPLTIGAVSVGVIVLVLLVISVLTLIVSRARRTGRRRAQHTRCQLAIRQFDARNNSLARDNGGFSEDQTSQPPAVRALPRSTYNLLECPVCLELAWPPKKIFQCREGHIVCDTCKANPNLKTCPMCRISFSNNLTSRNR